MNEKGIMNILVCIHLPLPVHSYEEVQTVVHYRCSPNRSISYSLRFHRSITPLQIWVESPCACPNACTLVDVGPGTIFLIILCLSITAYFILGTNLACVNTSTGKT